MYAVTSFCTIALCTILCTEAFTHRLVRDKRWNARRKTRLRRAAAGSESNSDVDDDNDSRDRSQFRSLPQAALIRGERYGDSNSTLPSPAAIAERLNVEPTAEVSAGTWQRAWKAHRRLLPLLHSTDGCRPTDSSLNVACMWWKALSGNDKSSPVFDDGLAYDLLPSGWRKLVSSKVRRFYPRLHHGNVELRTAYLDGCVSDVVKEVKGLDDGKEKIDHRSDIKIRLVCMGAGYDTRGIKMLERGLVDRVVELDLPEVVDAKRRLFQRLMKRRPKLRDLEMPELVASDFNDISGVRTILDDLLETDDPARGWFTIFVFEGVMIYLDEGAPSDLLNVTSSVLRERGLNGALCLADRLENVPGGDPGAGEIELERNGWKIVDWSPKPGLARHMLSARLMRE